MFSDFITLLLCVLLCATQRLKHAAVHVIKTIALNPLLIWTHYYYVYCCVLHSGSSTRQCMSSRQQRFKFLWSRSRLRTSSKLSTRCTSGASWVRLSYIITSKWRLWPTLAVCLRRGIMRSSLRAVGGILLPWKRWYTCFVLHLYVCIMIHMFLLVFLCVYDDDDDERHSQCVCGGESCACV